MNERKDQKETVVVNFRSRQVASPVIQLGNDRHSIMDRAPLTSNLKSSTQELGYPDLLGPTSLQKHPRDRVQSRLVGPVSPLELPTSSTPPRHWKLLGDSFNTAQQRDSQNYQIKSQLRRSNRYLQPKDLISSLQILSPTNRAYL